MMQRFFSFLFAALLGLCGVTHAQTTTYPVQVNAYLQPPYSLYLSDYYSGTREKLNITLINRDQLKPMLNVRLRMIITAPGVRFQTNDNTYIAPIQVENGMPMRLTLDDLAPYFQPNVLTTSGYLTEGRLPEGMVEFCFQAIEAFTGQVLSASTCTRAFINSQKPPLLSLPLQNESVPVRDPLNLLFQWTPRHQGAAQVEYELIIKELWDNGMPVQAAFPYSPEIYRETTRSTSLLYGALQPPLLAGKRYAWCVRAQARQGMDAVNVFQNDGYSEIRSFTLQNDCSPPTLVKATAQRKRLTIEWETLPQHIGFSVSYRLRKSDGSAEWKEQSTLEPTVLLSGLKDSETYEYRVASYCVAGEPVYSPVFTVTLPQTDSARLAQCGFMPGVNLANQNPIQTLQGGDIIMASDYPVTITNVSGAAGVYTGEGWTEVPWLNDAKLAVTFEGIKVNTDKQLIDGFIDAKYDKTEGQIADLDKVFEGGKDAGNVISGITRVDYAVDFSIPGVESFNVNDDGDLVIDNAAGAPFTITPKNREGTGNDGNAVQVFPMTIKDKDNVVYQVVATETDPTTGKATAVKATRIGVQGSPLAENSFDRNQLNGDKAIVTFHRGSGKFAFDTWKTYYSRILLIKPKYQKLYTNYYAAWKLLPEGQGDAVEATIQVFKDSLDPAKVIFKTPTGTEYTAEYSNGTYRLQIASGPVNDVQELYALYPNPDEPGKYWTLGKLGIATYAAQTHKVVLVPVNDAPVDEADIRNMLKTVYDSVGVTWQVEVAQNFTYGAEDKLMTNGSGLSTYNASMRDLNNAFKASLQADGKALDNSASYLFFLKATGAPTTNKRDYVGFMPRGAQYGYIFTSEIPKARIPQVVAHELGHGRWKLYHPFDSHYGAMDGSKETDNVMSYGETGDRFAKWQWDIMADPAMLVSIFESDGGSEYSTGEYFTKLLQQIRCAFASKQDEIDMPEKYRNGGSKEPVTFDYGLQTPQSEINGLKLRGAKWSATRGKKKITGILNPIIDAQRGIITLGDFQIQVPVEVYHMNSGLTPFEHFKRYLFPGQNDVLNEFRSVWRSGIGDKIQRDEDISYSDITKLKAIASCGTKYLDVDSRYELIQAVMNYSTREYYEDLILDIIQTTPDGLDSKNLFLKINGNRGLLIKLIRHMDDLGGEEKNFSRLGKEYYYLFARGYTKKELEDKYKALSEDKKLYFYGFGMLCSWSIKASRDDGKITFTETQISNVTYPTHNPLQDGSSGPKCDSDDVEYSFDVQELVSVSLLERNFLDKKNQVVVMPLSVYYILVKSYWNSTYYDAAQAAWLAIGLVTPIDEFWLLGKAVQFSTRGIQMLRFRAIRNLAKNSKLPVVLNDNGKALKELSAGKIDDFVKWEATKGAEGLANLKKLNDKASSVSIPWKNLDDKNIIWVSPNNNLLHTAKSFANEKGTSLYDLVLKDNYYVKFDLLDGRILLGNTLGDYKAFGVIESASFSTFKSSVLTVDNAVFNEKLFVYLSEHAEKLKVLCGAAAKTLNLEGKATVLNPNKVSTFLGRFRPDIKNLFTELGSYKNVGLGENVGGVNLLNKPDHYYDELTWWGGFNKPWLDRAISRGDDVYLATIPRKAEDLLDKAGNLKGAYAQELNHLVERGYKPANVSDMEWFRIHSWLDKPYVLNGARLERKSVKEMFDTHVNVVEKISNEGASGGHNIVAFKAEALPNPGKRIDIVSESSKPGVPGVSVIDYMVLASDGKGGIVAGKYVKSNKVFIKTVYDETIWPADVMKDFGYRAFGEAMANKRLDYLGPRMFDAVIDGRTIQGYYWIDPANGMKIPKTWWIEK